MARKLSLLLAAIAVVAFAAPAVASATELKEGTTSVPVGTEVVAQVTGTELTSPLGTFSCEGMEDFRKVKQNGGGTLELTELFWRVASCHVGKRVDILTGFAMNNLKSSEEGVGSVAIFMSADVGALKCAYSGTVPFTFTPGSDTLFIHGSGFTASAEICEPEEGEEPVTYSAHLTLTTTNGTPLTIS